MQPVNPLLPETGFVVEKLLPPRQAIVAYFSRVTIDAPRREHVSLDAALGRVVAESIQTGCDHPDAARSMMDGFALHADATPGDFRIVDDVRMGVVPQHSLEPHCACRIPTGGILPGGADCVVPIEETCVRDAMVTVAAQIQSGANVAERGADMRAGEAVITAGRRLRAPEIAVLATLGITSVPVDRQPVVAVFSSGDELVEPSACARPGEIRDSNRYAIAASLRAMGAQPRHYPTLRDEAADVESAIERALAECDGVVISGGSSVGERDRLPDAVAQVAKPGIIVHGLRVKPGKPTLLGAHGGKPIIGLPGNPTSALMMLQAVAVPIVAAMVGGPLVAPTLKARLTEPLRSRRGWTWFIPVCLHDDGAMPSAHPLALRSFSVSLLARADGFVVMDEREEEWPAGTTVSVVRFW